MVTGCSSGIGKEAALRLAQQGGRVVMACRNKDKMSAAADDIRREVPDAKIDQLVLDLASMVCMERRSGVCYHVAQAVLWLGLDRRPSDSSQATSRHSSSRAVSTASSTTPA